MQPSESSLLESMGRQLRDKSLYALGFCSEMLITPDDTVLVSLESYADEKTPRKKAVLHHKASVYYLSSYIICIVLVKDICIC